MRTFDYRRSAAATIDVLAIRCPRCGREAAFEPPWYALQRDEAKAAAADPSLTGVWRGKAYVVIRYPQLLSWSDLVRLRREMRQVGICRCGACGYLNRHLLDWPREAFYAVSLRGRTLWMRSREHAAALRGYVAAEDRHRIPGARSLSRVPKEFLAARNRAPLVKKLDRLLAEGPEPRAVPSRPDPLSPRPRR
ncbi:MAG TPA: hypothetical protein VM890_02560 [Longimicrobium sp.]|jgi:hypothetical protein|nr:hypothetical protein [Longimicrobium sp.]